MRRSLLAAALAVALLLAAFATIPGATSASPQPDDVCTICDDDRLPDDGGTSTITVDVREDGDAEWRIAVEIENETLADELRENPPELGLSPGTSLVDAPYDEPTVTVTEDDVLVVEFVDRNAARSTPGGTLLVDYLHAMGDPGGYEMNVDRFVIRGPDGYVAANDPSEVAVSGRTAAWSGDRSYVHGAFVVFAPEDAAAKGVRATVAKGIAVSPIVAGNSPIVLFSASIFAGLLGAIAGGTRLLVGGDGRRFAGVCVVSAAVAVLSLPLLFQFLRPAPHVSPWISVPAVALLGASFVRLDRRQSVGAVLGATVAFAVELSFLLGLARPIHGLAMFAALIGSVGIPAVAAPLVVAGATAEKLRAGER